MVAIAKQDQKKRTIQVNRQQLLAKLRENRAQHLRDYEEAMAGYKASLLRELESAFVKAKDDLAAHYEKTKKEVESLTDEDISKQSDYFTLVEDVTVEMKVPRSHEEAYDSAIAMAEWDVNDTMELSYEEFTCFVQDKWDWSRAFENLSTMYKRKRLF